MSAAAPISALHPGLLGMVKAMRDQPERWFSVAEDAFDSFMTGQARAGKL